jgi:RHS repeat-associated protein
MEIMRRIRNKYGKGNLFDAEDMIPNTKILIIKYFGARYYDHKSYRFNSVDPVINREEALASPQLWNLYAYCRNNPVTYFDPAGRKIQIKNKELINEFEQTLGIRLKFEDKNNPNLVTGFTVKHKQLKEMLKMLQEIIDSPILINIIDKSETDHDSLSLIIGGASFDEGDVYIDRSVYFQYNKKGGGQRTMPVGEKILHELIGHGYDYIKREKSTEKKAIRRINENYRRPLGIEERVEK